VSVSFFGDGATGEGVLYESMNFASLYRLPVVFVCENNLYSTHLPILKIRPRRSIAEVAAPFHMKVFREDGNDVLRVFETARKAVAWCRSGKGPVFIEFFTYRLRGHVGPDDNIQGTHTDIRPPHELAKWKKLDPIPKFEKYLLKNKILSEAKIARIKRDTLDEISNAHALAAQSNRPPAEEIGKYVFRETGRPHLRPVDQ
jgi:pyruvate dehydrogenase E1 component alpha subunit